MSLSKRVQEMIRQPTLTGRLSRSTQRMTCSPGHRPTTTPSQTVSKESAMASSLIRILQVPGTWSSTSMTSNSWVVPIALASLTLKKLHMMHWRRHQILQPSLTTWPEATQCCKTWQLTSCLKSRPKNQAQMLMLPSLSLPCQCQLHQILQIHSCRCGQESYHSYSSSFSSHLFTTWSSWSSKRKSHEPRKVWEWWAWKIVLTGYHGTSTSPLYQAVSAFLHGLSS